MHGDLNVMFRSGAHRNTACSTLTAVATCNKQNGEEATLGLSYKSNIITLIT